MKRTAEYNAQDVPNQPGIYIFRNREGRVIYVGKAKNLKKRLSTYFQPSRRGAGDPKTRSLLNSIAYYEIEVVNSDQEALLLESKLIKEYTPRYNVELRDDKRYMLVCVDLTEGYPHLGLTRLEKDDGKLYFGPFPHARSLRETIRFLSQRFGLRTCTERAPSAETAKHCLEQDMKRCSCPCLGEVSEAEYAERLYKALAVLRGETREIVEDLKTEMQDASEKRNFEAAAKLRDMLSNIQSLCEPYKKSRRDKEKASSSSEAENACLELRDVLGLEEVPEVVECFDISNISGTLSVGSMVCFKNGKPWRKGYRRYRIRTVDRADDYAMLQEVVTRRYLRLLREGKAFPDLIIIDGGSGQLNAVIEAMVGAEIPVIPVVGLAKRREELHLPGYDKPLRLSGDSEALKFLQHVRDEAHRFAVAYHRKLRNKRISNSLLDEIQGVGPSRRDALLKAFGSVRQLRQKSSEEIAHAVPGLGIKLAEKIVSYLEKHCSGK